MSALLDDFAVLEDEQHHQRNSGVLSARRNARLRRVDLPLDHEVVMHHVVQIIEPDRHAYDPETVRRFRNLVDMSVFRRSRSPIPVEVDQ